MYIYTYIVKKKKNKNSGAEWSCVVDLPSLILIGKTTFFNYCFS